MEKADNKNNKYYSPKNQTDRSETLSAIEVCESKKNNSKNGKKASKKPTTKRLFLNLLIKIACIAMILFLTFNFLICVNLHYGNNMHPAVRDGDLVIAYRLQKPYINSAVLYENDSKTCVGRVIAFEGDEINITEEGKLTVNGISPAEEVFYPTVPAENSKIAYPYKVESGKAFVLNDFRTDTDDSRTFGAVDLKDIKGTLLLTMRHRDF